MRPQRLASPRPVRLVDALIARLSVILPWDAAAAKKVVALKQDLAATGMPIGGNDVMIGHMLAAECLPVTNGDE